MGFMRKSVIVGTGGLARAAGVRGYSKKERQSRSQEKMYKLEKKQAKLQAKNQAK